MILEEVKSEKHWFKKSILIFLYHAHLISKYGTRRGSKWRVEDTARELDLSVGFISESITIARFATKYPEIEECKNKEDALKICKANRI